MRTLLCFSPGDDKKTEELKATNAFGEPHTLLRGGVYSGAEVFR